MANASHPISSRRVASAPLALALLCIGLLVSCGSGSDAGSSQPTRTVEVKMVDNAFEPTSVTVREGETVRFQFTNAGSQDHEAIIGDAKAQADHEDEMSGSKHDGGMDGMDDMGHGGSSDDAVAVAAGKQGRLVHTFEAGDDLLIGCHEPGHYKAGMRLRVTVS